MNGEVSVHFLQPSVIAFLIDSNIFLSTLFLNTPSLCYFCNVRDVLPSFTPIQKNRQNYISLCNHAFV